MILEKEKECNMNYAPFLRFYILFFNIIFFRAFQYEQEDYR
jgi:hypothetical protein